LLCHFLFLRLHACKFLLSHFFLLCPSLHFSLLLRLSPGHICLMMAPLSFSGSLLLLSSLLGSGSGSGSLLLLRFLLSSLLGSGSGSLLRLRLLLSLSGSRSLLLESSLLGSGNFSLLLGVSALLFLLAALFFLLLLLRSSGYCCWGNEVFGNIKTQT
jgi:hypothetical protein